MPCYMYANILKWVMNFASAITILGRPIHEREFGCILSSKLRGSSMADYATLVGEMEYVIAEVCRGYRQPPRSILCNLGLKRIEQTERVIRFTITRTDIDDKPIYTRRDRISEKLVTYYDLL